MASAADSPSASCLQPPLPPVLVVICEKKRKRQAWKQQKKLLRTQQQQLLLSSSLSLPTAFPPLPPTHNHRLLSQYERETAYVLTPLHRHVIPYPFTLTAFAKPRWYGRPLLSVLRDEFVAFPASHFLSAITAGRICVNGSAVTAEHTVRNGDRISHSLHRHEPPVPAASVRLLPSSSPHVLRCDKPAGLPCHAGGQWRHNSLQVLLLRQTGRWLSGLWRLDRATSGLMLFCTDDAMAAGMRRRMQDKAVTKLYIASDTQHSCTACQRLHAAPPPSHPGLTSSVSLTVSRVSGHFPSSSTRSPVVVSAAIRSVDRRMAQFGVHESGRACQSSFRLIDYDDGSDSSLVLCQPVTGRTHQLRVHLQHVGHPIVNDARYGGRRQGEQPRAEEQMHSEEDRGEEDEQEDEAQAEAETEATGRRRETGRDGDAAEALEDGEEEAETAAARLARIQRDSFDPSCPQCKDPSVFSFRRMQEEEKMAPQPLLSLDSAAVAGVGVDVIWLHAWRYDIDGSSYEVDWPDWAGGSTARSRWLQAEAQCL